MNPVLVGWLLCAMFNLTCLIFYKPTRDVEPMIEAAGGWDRMIKVMAVVDVVLAPLVTVSILYGFFFGPPDLGQRRK